MVSASPISSAPLLNADLGEGCAHDAALMPLIDIANIACGAHAGDRATMRQCLRWAADSGTRVGAHPGHADPAHFGRRLLPIEPAQLRKLLAEQVEGLAELSSQIGLPLDYIKLHGALYHQVDASPELALAMLEYLRSSPFVLTWIGPPRGAQQQMAQRHGLRYLAEGFADRGYAADDRLLPRSAAQALLGPAAAARQAQALMRDGLPSSGARVDTLCIHGDGEDPVSLVQAVRKAIEDLPNTL